MINRAEKSPANPKTIIDSIEGFWLIWESNHGADSRATQSILRFAKSERQFLDAWLVPFADQLASVLDFGGFLVNREFTGKNARVLFLPQIQKV